MSFDVLIIGCGYVGRRAAARWISQGKRVAAVTRGHANELAKLQITPIAGDVLEPSSLVALPQARTVLHAIGLDRNSGHSMRDVYVQGLENVLASLPRPDRFLFVSSTSVYGQTDGGWVTEDSPTEPDQESGRVVLEAERLLRSRIPAAIVLRFAGIYGPARLLKKEAIVNGLPIAGDCEKWLNLIHVEDGVEAILAAEAHANPGTTFNIADGSPVSRREFYAYWAEILDAPPTRFDHQGDPRAPHRKISSQTAQVALGWRPRHPTYREGLKNVS